MQSHTQRRRQLEALRPRQPKNDVNTGAIEPAEADSERDQAVDASPALRQAHFMKRCAQRDLI